MRKPEIECIAIISIILCLLILGLMEKAEQNQPKTMNEMMRGE